MGDMSMSGGMAMLNSTNYCHRRTSREVRQVRGKIVETQPSQREKRKTKKKQTKERLSYTQCPMNSIQLHTSSHKVELHSLTSKKYNVEILILDYQ